MSKKTGSKSKLTKIILLVVLVIIAVGAGSLAYFDSQYNARIAKDKQRFETALADINKFFDENSDKFTDRKVERRCGYGTGPFGETAPLTCTVAIEAKLAAKNDNFNPAQLIDLSDGSEVVLGWGNQKEIQGTDSKFSYWISGERSGLNCFGAFDKSEVDNKAQFYCDGRAEAQHYPRVDR